MRADLQALLERARADASPTAAGAKLVSLDELHAGRRGSGQSTQDEPQLSFEALRGRLIELSGRGATAALSAARSEERRVGKECRRLCRSRWSPYH
jgi:hypothetical protein